MLLLLLLQILLPFLLPLIIAVKKSNWKLDFLVDAMHSHFQPHAELNMTYNLQLPSSFLKQELVAFCQLLSRPYWIHL